MKAGWKIVKLGEVTEINSGLWKGEEGALVEARVYRATNFFGNGELSDDNLVTISVEFKKLAKRSLQPGDILLEKSGGGPNQPVGRVGYFDKHEPLYSFSNFTSRIRVLPGVSIDAKYLHKYLFWVHLRGDTAGMQNNSTNIRNLDLEKYRAIEIPLPPLAEQKRIVELLDEAFAGIDEAKAKAEANLDNAIGLFEMVREDLMREPEAQMISYGFDDICRIDSILVDPRLETNAGKLHVGGANIESKTGRLVALQTARQEGLKSGKFPFQKGMVLYSKIRPNLMKVARPDFDGLCSADMYPLAPVDGRVCRDYLYHLLLTERFTRFALLGSERAGMPKVNRDYLSRFTTKLPSIGEQQAFASKLDALEHSLSALRELLTQKMNALRELKSSLLSQSLAGELTA